MIVTNGRDLHRVRKIDLLYFGGDMSDGTIAVLIYFAVLAVLILSSGFVVKRFNYDKNETDGIVIASIMWPIAMFAIPVFYAMRFMHKAGSWIASKI
jgi:riboflavin transporter FmnP